MIVLRILSQVRTTMNNVVWVLMPLAVEKALIYVPAVEASQLFKGAWAISIGKMRIQIFVELSLAALHHCCGGLKLKSSGGRSSVVEL